MAEIKDVRDLMRMQITSTIKLNGKNSIHVFFGIYFCGL